MTDRAWDRRLRVKTEGRENETGATYAPYEPTPYRVLERLAQSGALGAQDHVLDYGCGKGRAAFFLAAVLGCRVTGIDRSQKLIDMAEANRQAFVAPDRVRFIRCEAEKYAPRDENAFFFFNPFSVIVFDAVLRRLSRLACDAARPLTVCCYYPSEDYLARLNRLDGAEPVADIDCNDLFDRKSPRERLVVYRLTGGDEIA